MDKSTIDINADLGEGAGNDADIMPLVSSCNIAIGGHFGDADTMREAVMLAQKNGVRVGAHPSFPDRENFGRKMCIMSPGDLEDSLLEQLTAFNEICSELGVDIHHIKPHGALYNQGAEDADCVGAMLKAFRSLPEKPVIYLRPNTKLHAAVQKEFPVWTEAFIDRRYAAANTLQSRSESGALITSPEKAWAQTIEIFAHQRVSDITGQSFQLEADTYCIHGDQAGAVAILEYIHAQLDKKGIALA